MLGRVFELYLGTDLAIVPFPAFFQLECSLEGLLKIFDCGAHSGYSRLIKGIVVFDDNNQIEPTIFDSKVTLKSESSPGLSDETIILGQVQTYDEILGRGYDEIAWQWVRQELNVRGMADMPSWSLPSISYSVSGRERGWINDEVLWSYIDVSPQLLFDVFIWRCFDDVRIMFVCLQRGEQQETYDTGESEPYRNYFLVSEPSANGNSAQQESTDYRQPEEKHLHNFALHEFERVSAAFLLAGIGIGFALGFIVGLKAEKKRKTP